MEGHAEEGVFESGGALETPAGVGDGLDEAFLDGAFGIVGGFEGGAVVLVDLLFFGGEDEDLAGESVAEGVQAATGLAFGSARAGGTGVLGGSSIVNVMLGNLSTLR